MNTIIEHIATVLKRPFISFLFFRIKVIEVDVIC